jgi:hypothetical protein
MRRLALKFGPTGRNASHLAEHSPNQNAPLDAFGGTDQLDTGDDVDSAAVVGDARDGELEDRARMNPSPLGAAVVSGANGVSRDAALETSGERV